MNGTCLTLVKHILWRLRPEDPALLDLEFLPGWSLVNPLLHPHASPIVLAHVEGRSDLYDVSGLIDGELLVRSAFLILVRNGDGAEPFGSYIGGSETFKSMLGGNFLAGSETLKSLLERWRHVSKQALLAVSPMSYCSEFSVEVPSLPKPQFPIESDCSKALVPRQFVDGALTYEHLAAADALPTEFSPPIHDTLLLDAVAAWIGYDYRRAVLDSAIAVEAMVNTRLEAEYERVCATPTLEHRVVQLPARSGAVTKDPVYEALSASTSFSRLLHERSLYLLKRSLLLEDKALYDEALALYGTRNKIAHRGAPPEGANNLLSIDREGGLTAIDCAIRVFEWYGERGDYYRPSQEHVGMLGLFASRWPPAAGSR